MTAIEIANPGKTAVMQPVQRPVPQPSADEVLIRVEAAGLNRGDIMQRLGHYPPPPGITDIPGLEVSGRIAGFGANVTDWTIGERVCALIAGGGYAEYAIAPALQCLSLPDSLTMVEGAALPETLFTCWTNLVDDGRIKAGDILLIHGGASGIGTTGIQLGKALGAQVFVTAGSEEKCAACRDLGADLAINYKEQDFVAEVARATNGRGVDIVLDMVGGDYVGRSMEAMAVGGRHISIGVMKSPQASIMTYHLIQKRLILTGSTLRGRTPAQKGEIADAIVERIWPAVADRTLKAIVYRTFPLEQALAAQGTLEGGDHIGKVILTTRYNQDK